MYQQIDVAKTSLLSSGGSGIKEYYIPLWVYSSGGAGPSTSTSLGTSFLMKGSNSVTTGSVPQSTLYTLSQSWPVNQEFAFEASLFSGYGASITLSTALWDRTTSSLVSNSQISIASSSTSASLMRSSTFTLIPNHAYGITLSVSNASYNVYLTKAHLVAFFT